jgi:phosphodiesterase/alkaline phosphatase D-like protein
VTGLQPDTTYHFALVTTNFGGGVSVGPDATFTTRPLVPPGLSTGGAQEVEGTSAALTGTLDPEGLASTYRFEYGTSTAYGSSWPLVQVFAGSGSTAEGVAVSVPNLQPGTTYHYRLVASNEDGTSYGADETFSTPGYPVSVVQETPVLAGKLGFVNPEAGKSSGKASKPKGHGKKGKAKKRGRHGKAKGGKKGRRKG